MPINSVSGNTTLPVQRPDVQRPAPPGPRSEENPQRQDAEPRVTRAQQNTPATTVDTSQRDLPRLDAATQARADQSNEAPRPQPFERASPATQDRQALRTAAPETESSNSRVERADQARDALKARFEESSRPKPEAQFEVRA